VVDWPFEPLEFQEKSPEEMEQAAARFYDEIRRRRTVRDFSERPVSREIIEHALRAAGTAPSGANSPRGSRASRRPRRATSRATWAPAS
jgi:nitroreductase